MSSRKLPDKEFDRYARNILKKPEGIVFDEAAWTAMEGKLTEAAIRPAFFNLKWIIPAGILLILTSIGYWGYKSVDDVDDKILIVDTEVSEKVLDGSIKEEYANSDDDAQVNTAQTSFSRSLENTSEKEQATTDFTRTKSMAQTSDAEIQSKEIVRAEKSKPLEQPTNKLTDKGREEVQKEQVGDPYGFIEEEVDEEPTLNEFESKTLDPFQELILPAYEMPDAPMVLNTRASASDTLSATTEDQIDENQTFRRWRVGVTVAPDYTTVGKLEEFTSPGFDFGFSLEYLIGKRLSITSGAILTQKLYNTTDFEEYTVPSGFWYANWRPEEILANCKVIDIPINIRYLVVGGKKTSLFGSAGLSSYLMLNERYDYNYGDWPGNGLQPDGWEVSNENNHFFGVYNLSLGISRKLTKSIIAEAEPFLKNSIGGVGWGQVHLKSTGVLFHIKYEF